MTLKFNGGFPKINLIFRFDDFSAISHIEFEGKLLALLARYNIPITFGVVPLVYSNEWDPSPQVENPLSIEKINTLKPFVERGLVEIALHGCHHNTQAKRFLGHIPGEFYGLSLAEQRGRMIRGKNYLEDVFSTPIRTFIPPWNTYDEVTLASLVDLGFSCISSGPRFGPVTPDGTLSYIPALCKLTDLQEVIKKVRRIQSDKAWITVWFHEYDFFEVVSKHIADKKDIGFLEELFSWLCSQPDIVMMTLGQAIEQTKEFTPERYRWAVRLRRYQHLTPPFLRFMQDIPGYYPSKYWLSMKFFHWLAAMISYYAVLFILGVSTSLILSNLSMKPLVNLIGLSLGVCIAGILIFMLRSRKIFYRSLSILILSTGGFISTLFILFTI